MFFVTFQSRSKEKPDGVRGPLDEPIINTPCGRQSTVWGWGCDSSRTAPGVLLSSQQDELQLPLQGVSCGRMGCAYPASWHPLQALWQSFHYYELRAVATYNLPDEGLPVWAWDNLSAQEPCQMRDPKELPRLFRDGKQLAEGPRGQCSCPSSSLPSHACTHQHPFGTFSHHGGNGLGALESQATITGSASSTFQATDLKSCGESRE